jgi:hypothetical protein
MNHSTTKGLFRSHLPLHRDMVGEKDTTFYEFQLQY